MKPRALLVNPPIYDFAAYDFWLKPYGLLSVAGFLRGKADFQLFDYLDRLHPFAVERKKPAPDQRGRGRFLEEKIQAPACLRDIPRHFRRFGLPKGMFEDFLERQKQFDFVFIQTTMTYWYMGVKEVIEDVRKYQPIAKIILGGNYVTLCGEHSEKLGADLLIKGVELGPLWQFLNLEPDLSQPPLWELYEKLNTGVLKLSDGCPFNCTYCSVPRVYGKFRPRPKEKTLAELELLKNCGAENIAFYDDALLYQADDVMIPFLKEVIKRNMAVNFHTPNALNARFVTGQAASLMVKAGFKTFYLGFESASAQWQDKTGSKVSCDELEKAVEILTAEEIDHQDITAYQILGHPNADSQQIEESMRFVNRLGIRGMLADFSPIPGTLDGEYCRKWVNLDEPLMHNKTVFPIIMLGNKAVNRFKELQRQLNGKISRKTWG